MKWDGQTAPVNFRPVLREWAPVHTANETRSGNLPAPMAFVFIDDNPGSVNADYWTQAPTKPITWIDSLSALS